MKRRLKQEVLLPLLIIHAGIITMVLMILFMVPYNLVAAYLLMGSSICTVGGTVMLWRFVVGELHSIDRCTQAIATGEVENWHADRDDELGELEEQLIAATHK